MSPSVHRYSHSSELSAPFFNSSPMIAVVIVGLLWGSLRAVLPDSALPVLIWFAITPFLGILVYITWLALIVLRYRVECSSRDFVQTVERIKTFVGYPDSIQVWERASDHPLLMSSRTILYGAILASGITMKDILDSGADGEIALAFKIARLARLSRIRVLLEAAFAFGVSAFDGWVVLVQPPLWLHSIAIVLFLALVDFMVATGVLNRTEGQQPRGKSIGYKHIADLYGQSAILSFGRVFGPREVAEKDKGEIEKPESGLTAEVESVPQQLISQVEEMLRRGTKGDGYHVSVVTQGDDKGALDILRQRGYSRNDAICTVPRAIVRVIPRADMLGSYVLYEVAAAETKRRKRTYLSYCLMPALVLCFASLFSPSLSHSDFPLVFLLLFCLYCGAATMVLRFWSRATLFKLEFDLARQYPGYIESIEALVEANYASDPGAVSLSERLRRLQIGIAKQNGR